MPCRTGGPGIESTSLDPLVTPQFIGRAGAVAIKLLVIWRAGRDRGQRAGLVSAFIDSRVHGESARMSQVAGGPWVVLSNGVRQADFADAVRIACEGGAHGFLAGRAIWSGVIGVRDEAAALRDRSARRLDQLVDIVEHSMRQRVSGNAREEG